MRKWLVLASFDENGQRLEHLASEAETLDRVAVIETADGEQPGDAEIVGAFEGVTEGGEFLFVPLDGDTFSGRVSISQRVEIAWEGNYV